MRIRLPRLVLAGLASFGLASVTPTITSAADPQDVEILARGPVHEAFAATLEVQKEAVLVKQAPPEAIEELPPDQKPSGENVQWVPGYWHYDEEREDYIWISGFWRVPPPGRVWVAGSWREVRGGYQWTHGFWQEARVEQRAEVEYLAQPPAQLELAPSIPAPSETHVYVPGSWVWRNRYVWRPGFWVDHRPGWTWVPAHYRWTPAGYIFIDGYWDMPLAERGVLFAPVYVPRALYVQPAYVYTPTIVVSEPALYTSLFVRRGWGCYYFGDYYDNRYINRGWSSWAVGVNTGSGFGISVGFSRGVRYDPLWDYYRVANRGNIGWSRGIYDTFDGRFNGTVARPPRTLVQQNVIVNNITNNNITNVTNNTVIVNNNTTVNNNQMMLTSLNTVAATNKTLALKPIQQEQRVQEQQFARELKQVSAQRKQLETSIVDRGQTVKGTETPKTVRLEVPKSAVVRAQVPTPQAKVNPVPPPAASLVGKPNPANTAVVKPTPLTPTPPTAAQKPEPTKPEATKPTTPAPSPAPKPVTPAPKPEPNPAPKPTTPAPAPTPKPMTPAPTPAPAPKPLSPAPAPTPAPKPMTPAPAPTPAPKPMTPAPAPAPAPKPVAPTPAPAPKPTPAPPSNPKPPTETLRSAPTFTAPQRIAPAPAPAPAPPPSAKPSAPPPPSSKPSTPSTPSNKPAPSDKPNKKG